MNTKKISNLISKFLIIFLIIQPIFDLKIFYNSISTLIRVILIFMFFIYYFFTTKNKKKYYLLIYPLLIGIYFVLHHINALKFTSLVPGNFNYSIFKELLYFIKMLTPFLLIYSLYKANFSINTIMYIMKSLVLIIGLVIVVSNFFMFSYGNYSDTLIKANFFDWFNNNSPYTYQDLASKGLFEYGNQISAILIMFLPFMIYGLLQKKSFTNGFILCLNILSLILLCTKVSVLGILVVVIFTIFACLFISFIHKKHFTVKNYIPIGIVLVAYFLLLPINPMFNRIQERATIAQNYNSQNAEIVESINNTTSNIEEIEEIITDTPILENITVDESLQDSEKIEYIEANYQEKKLNKQFILENYPYKYDLEFWYNFLQNDIWVTTDYRFIELSMIQRVVQINNNKMDMWFGITNTRLQNIFNIEKDFVVQYYALGIIGTIFVFAPYFILLGIFAYKTIRNKFKNLKETNLLSSITIIFLFAISFFTGNLLNSLSFTIYFCLCFFIMLYNEK